MNKRSVSSFEGRWLGNTELQLYTNLGLQSAIKLAQEAKAVYRVGKRVLYDRVKIDSYIVEQKAD